MENNLEFVRFTQPAMFSLIPKELFEQVAETDETLIVENVYKYGPESLMNPATFFYGIIDPQEKKTVGFLWGGVNLLTNRLDFTYMSLDKKYQQNGILNKFKELAEFICKTYNLSRTYYLFTLHPSVAERFGGRESKIKLYEFDSKGESNE